MKKILFFLVCSFCYTVYHAQQAAPSPTKDYKAPSDAPSGYTYNFDKVFAALWSEMSAPSGNNQSPEYQLIHSKDFPKTTQTLHNEVYGKALLRKWMEEHPDMIINAYKTREDIVTPFAR
ncbi:MAG: hypothetical protein QM534_16825 [Sediminibacterium sp.]|nr:hypothetical protein [Sediminibacterium sp.]